MAYEMRIRDWSSDVCSSDLTTQPKGEVIDQSPGEGDSLNKGGTVTIVVSAYEEPSETPSSETPTPTNTDTTESPLTDDPLDPSDEPHPTSVVPQQSVARTPTHRGTPNPQKTKNTQKK